MISFLLAVIYLAYVSLGLPDSLLGSAWPVMHVEMGAPISWAGVVSMIIAGGTIISSLCSDRLTYKLGAGVVTALSVVSTAVALFGFSTATSFWMLCVWAIPYGLGAGACDAALNNYTALHYSARHVSWLHGCWGVGASISPYIMSYALAQLNNWHTGYRIVSFLQAGLAALIIISLPMWKKRRSADGGEDADAARPLGVGKAIRIRGVPFVLLAFFGYCGLETTAGLWASSYLVEARNVDVDTAARFASLYFLGITVGRFLNGLIANRLKDHQLIRGGLAIVVVGLAMMLWPAAGETVVLAGLVVLGLGCAPIYPSVIHATPANFGKQNSQAIVGIQMASAYTGSTFMPPLFGLIAQHINIGLYPAYLALFAVLMIVMTELLNRNMRKYGPAN